MSEDWRMTKRYLYDYQILDMLKDLDRIVDFFVHRDEMNSDVHVSEVRESPITSLAKSLRQELGCLPMKEPRDA